MTEQTDTESHVFCVVICDVKFEFVHQVRPGRTIIGRNAECPISLADARVSREHAVIDWTGTLASIRDLNSRNGTIVGGIPIRGEVKLSERTDIQIGPYTLKVCFRTAEAIRQSFHLDGSTRSDAIHAADNTLEELSPLKLTPAQRRVYEGFIQGLSEKEVAAQLKISIHTVHSHAKAIYKVLEVCSRPELVKRGISGLRLQSD